MTYNTMIAVIAGQRDGKTIEFRPYGDPDRTWTRWGNGNRFDFVTTEFRIKPEPPKPREVIVFFWNHVEPTAVFDEGDARIPSIKANPETTNKLIRFREVLPNEEGEA